MKPSITLTVCSFGFLILMASSFLNHLTAQDVPAKKPIEEGVTYQFVEKPAQFPGGEEAMRKYLVEHMKYPEEAREKKIEGIVYVEFVIEMDGEVTNVRVRRGAHPLLDQAAVKIVEGMPHWIPGEQRGRKVRSMFVLPIQFQLSKDAPKTGSQDEKKNTSAIVASISLAIGSIVGLILLLR
jgi:TonB family protein